MTLDQIASSVRNRVADGLSGNISDQAFSLEQLKDEIDLARADFAYKYDANNKVDVQYFVQELPPLEIHCENLSDTACVLPDPTGEVPVVKIPKVLSLFHTNPIEYAGLVNMQQSFPVYTHPDDIRMHKVRNRTKHLPFAWLDLATDPDDTQKLVLFNLGKYNSLKYLKVRMIAAHPRQMYQYLPIDTDIDYPAPLHIQQAIIDSLSAKYVEYYRKLNVLPTPNTQSDPIT
jgi:hypothetical protein